MLQKEKNLPSDEFKPYLKAVNIQPSGVSISSVEEMWFSIHELRSLRLRKGDLLISEGGDVGRSAIWNDELPECYIQNAINRARPRRNQSSSFLYYWMMMLKESSYIEVLCNKATIAHYTVDKLESSPLFLPPDSEAETIAAFLDHETAKIDALIEKQQRLIELLKEKRQAVISHAVTKGLNPNAPMKDSGVEWLGEVPAHWQIAPLKRFADVIDCKHFTVQFLDEGLPIVSIRELRDDLIDISNAKMTSRSEWNFLREGRIPLQGDIIFCRNASVGAAGYVNGDFDFCMGQDVCLIRTGLANRYMHFQITSRHVREQIEAFLVGATIRRANVEEIRGLVVAYPPENEQKKIEKHLETVLSEFDALSQKAERTVALLIERRTALISAAVTGKIDVRDWQAAA
ncbi:restriction endonuclease subunit S [Delftia tsuruhatensis]|uniref:restriction endonuclease subunit S n=1 Tax=Delftia tsuruhatensis TaxID=180282 RepID=UPI00208FFE54|nr:restriction endonuclease subunit S [Delftia tsuruhatensis]MCO5339959.1 restriction endonuclease subunit S [Delftia tsuruhatensis]MCR4548297.1 restriction endonuclease subunit S [Delftia tsuruhatensis]